MEGMLMATSVPGTSRLGLKMGRRKVMLMPCITPGADVARNQFRTGIDSV